MKKMRAKERVRRPEPHSRVRTDGPNSVWSSGDQTHLDWSGQPWGGLELGRWTGITEGRTASLWGGLPVCVEDCQSVGRLQGAREQAVPL